MTLDHITKQDQIHITLEQGGKIALVERLGFRESPSCYVVVESLQRPRADRAAGQAIGLGYIDAVMSKKLAKTERRNHGFHRSPSHGGGHFAAQKLGGRAAHEDLHVLFIQDSPHKDLPAVYRLDLIEAERDFFGTSILGKLTVVLVDDEPQSIGTEPGQTFVLEVEVNQTIS